MKKYLREIILLIIVLWVFSIIMSILSCNPVKKVLRDPEKFDVVKEEVLRRGYCVNDTTIISSSDTLVTTDTVVKVDYFYDILSDTTTIYRTKNHYITKKIVIKDTIRAIVQDMARIKLLQADSAALSKKAIDYKAKADKYLNWLLLAIASIGLYFFFKYKP